MTDSTPKDVLALLATWFSEEQGVEVTEDGLVTVDGESPLQLRITIDDERAVLTHERTEAGAGTGRADAIIAAFPDRGTSMQATAAVDRTGARLTITNHVFVDGLNRQAAVAALNELVAAIDAIQPADHEAMTRVEEPIVAEVSTAADDAATTLMAATATGHQATGFVATHRVPSGGMRAWPEPDPSLQPTARLEAGVELFVSEQRGDWANVVGSNGWTGWVDARQLIGTAAAGRGDGLVVGGVRFQPLPLVAAVALIVSAFLPWVGQIASANSLDVPLSFLWDFTSSGDPQLGWVIIALGAVALGLSLARQPMRGALLAVGVLALVISAAFVIQIYRGVTDLTGSSSDLFDWLGFAPWIALGAGVVLVASSTVDTT